MALHQLPDELARRFSATTGADGKAVFADLSPRDDVIGVRIGVDGLGAQDFDVAKRLTSTGEAAAEYTIALKPPGSIGWPGRQRRRPAGRGRGGRGLDQG